VSQEDRRQKTEDRRPGGNQPLFSINESVVAAARSLFMSTLDASIFFCWQVHNGTGIRSPGTASAFAKAKFRNGNRRFRRISQILRELSGDERTNLFVAKLQAIDNRNRANLPAPYAWVGRVQSPRRRQGYVGPSSSFLGAPKPLRRRRADRERASRTSRTRSPRRCNHRRNAIGTKGRKDHQEMMIINRKRASRQSRVGLPENRSLIPLRSL
jgi:hypothetical protein